MWKQNLMIESFCWSWNKVKTNGRLRIWTNIVDEEKLNEDAAEQEGIGKPLVKWIIRLRKKKPWSAKRHSQLFIQNGDRLGIELARKPQRCASPKQNRDRTPPKKLNLFTNLHCTGSWPKSVTYGHPRRCLDLNSSSWEKIKTVTVMFVHFTWGNKSLLLLLTMIIIMIIIIMMIMIMKMIMHRCKKRQIWQIYLCYSFQDGANFWTMHW